MADSYRLITSVAFGRGYDGLSVSAYLKDSSGVAVTSPTTENVVDLGNGNYTWDALIPDRLFRGVAVFRATVDGAVEEVVAAVNPADGQVTTGDGTIRIDHDYGGTDALAVSLRNGVRIVEAAVWCYRKTDYDAKRHSKAYVVAETRTDSNGRWREPLFLAPGDYVILIFKQGVIRPKAVPIAVA